VEIFYWGYNSDTFVFVLQEEGNKSIKYYFDSFQVINFNFKLFNKDKKYKVN
jgi:hypothetical protein